jgi:uncharacterized phage protein (TIGR02218 family)
VSRTLSAGIAAHLADSANKRVSMLRLDLADETTLALTDHDYNLPFDLGDGSVTYLAGTGILPSDVSLSTGFDADDIEVAGPIVEGGSLAGGEVAKAAILGGRFDDAVARFFQVNWDDLAGGAIKLLKGRVALAEVQGSQFKLTIHSEIGRFAQEVGRTITGYCDADFGDTRCGASPVTDAVTVTAVTSDRSFTVSNPNARADDFFNRGAVSFTSGALSGTRAVEVFDWTVGGVVSLWVGLAEPPEVGDTLNIRQGCYDPTTDESKTRAACMFFDNIVNFRGFPDVPGSDQVLRMPNPGG